MCCLYHFKHKILPNSNLGYHHHSSMFHYELIVIIYIIHLIKVNLCIDSNDLIDMMQIIILLILQILIHQQR